MDPLFKEYPELTPYQFASNRPIDGIDLDGLEYATFTIFISNGRVADIQVSKDYELKNKATKGPGIQYDYKVANKDGKYVGTQKSAFIKNMYGIYQGSDNPRLPDIGGKPEDNHWDYTLEPIDREDAAALKHDRRYDALYPKREGFSGVMHPSTTSANLEAAKEAFITIFKGILRKKDEVSQKTVTGKAVTGGFKMGFGFAAAEAIKSPDTIKDGVYSLVSKSLKSLGNFMQEIKEKTNAGISSIENMVTNSH